jgi:hypothetical protein
MRHLDQSEESANIRRMVMLAMDNDPGRLRPGRGNVIQRGIERAFLTRNPWLESNTRSQLTEVSSQRTIHSPPSDRPCGALFVQGTNCDATVAVNVTLRPLVICATEAVSVVVVATVLCVTTTLTALETELLSSSSPK